MKVFLFPSSRGFFFIWIGKGTPAASFIDPDWIHCCFPYDFETAEKYPLKINAFMDSRQCYIGDFSLEELLTCDDEKLRKWAIEQVNSL